MEKKELGVGQYVSTGTLFVKSRISPEVTKMSLTDHAKAAVLEYLTESDEFHKLVCDITGVERKQTKVSPELEKLKEDYSHMCESYEHEKQQRNDLIRKWREETAKRLDAERERDCAQRHHKFVMDEIFSMLKEVECSSVRGVVDELKSERANGKLLAEENEMCRRENDKLKLNYEKTNKELEAQEDLVKKYVAKSEKMRRLSISNKSLFFPEEGEIFFAEVPYNCVDRRVKTLVSKDNDPCTNCVFRRGELDALCLKVTCFEEGVQYTFRRVSDGKI
jgi:hypothetical protein